MAEPQVIHHLVVGGGRGFGLPASGAAGTGSVTWSGNRAIDLREATGVGPTVDAVGSVAGVTNQSIPGGGSDYTLDYAIGVNTMVEVFYRILIIDTTATKKRNLRYRVLVDRAAGAPSIVESTELLHYDEPASIYSADSPVALYGVLSISGNNLRMTITKHSTDNQKANVDLYPFVTAYPV